MKNQFLKMINNDLNYNYAHLSNKPNCLIGDSQFELMKQHESVMQHFSNFDFMSARASDSIEMLKFLNMHDIGNFKKIYLWLGTNDLGYQNDFELTKENLTKIVNICKSHADNVYIVSACYVNSIQFHTPEYLLENRSSEKIDQLNNLLKSFKDTVYLDLNSKLEEYNMLNSECTTDGLHISPKGYLELVKLIEENND